MRVELFGCEGNRNSFNSVTICHMLQKAFFRAKLAKALLHAYQAMFLCNLSRNFITLF